MFFQISDVLGQAGLKSLGLGWAFVGLGWAGPGLGLGPGLAYNKLK